METRGKHTIPQEGKAGSPKCLKLRTSRVRGAPPEVKLFASPTPDKCSMGRNTLPSHRPQTATEQKKSAICHWRGRSQVTRGNLVSFYNSYYKPREAVQHPEELWIFKNGLVKQKNWCSNFLLRYEPDLRLFRSWGTGHLNLEGPDMNGLPRVRRCGTADP